MSYACVEVVYGINLSDEDLSAYPALQGLRDRSSVGDLSGVFTPYSGGGDPFAFGVALGWEVSEGDDLLPPTPLTVTPEIEAAFQAQLAALRIEERASLAAFAQAKNQAFPRLFLLWSSS